MDMFFWGGGVNENVLQLIVVMAIQLCEYTKNQPIVPFKWMNCMVCELYLNKAVILRIFFLNHWKHI